MVPNLLFYQLLLVALVLICLMLHVWWPDHPSATPQTPLKPGKPRRQRSKAPKPFTGLIHKPLCEAYEPGADIRPKALARIKLPNSVPRCEDVVPLAMKFPRFDLECLILFVRDLKALRIVSLVQGGVDFKAACGAGGPN